jgi:peptide-methionine (S)-S-oxide reductase
MVTKKSEKSSPRASGGRSEQKLEVATFAAGCFWGVEDAFMRVKGVKETAVGYTGGKMENPTYKDVCTDLTGHAEAVEVKFDPKEISYGQLLEVFFNIHDPTQVDRQGPDFGKQYRSAAFYHNAEQKKLAEKAKNELAKSSGRNIATEISPASTFYRAEEHHQKYDEKNGFACHIINVEKIKHLLK